MCRRLSGHAILCSQGKWGRGAVPLTYVSLGSVPSLGGGLEAKNILFFSVTRPPARPPAHLSRRPFAQSPLTPHVLSHRRDITPAQAPRDGSAHSCGSTRTYGATPPRLGAAHGSNRCRPTTRLLPLPLSAMRPLRQCTPRTRRQIPLRLAAVAAMRPPPALIVTTRLLRYTFLPCAGERTAAAAVEPRVGRGNGLLARRCYVPARSWRVQGCA